MFSTHLVSINSTDSNANSTITFGGIDNSKFSSTMNYVPVTYGGPDWMVNTTIAVDGRTVPVLQQRIPVAFDTGTPNVVFNKTITEVGNRMESMEFLKCISIPGYLFADFTLYQTELEASRRI